MRDRNRVLDADFEAIRVGRTQKGTHRQRNRCGTGDDPD